MNYFKTSDGVKISYISEGSKEPIVLIHGWSGNKETFMDVINNLKNDYQIIAYDLRGHGQSDRPNYGLTMKRFAEDLRELIEHLDLKNPRLVGWSMGTHILLEYFTIYGDENIRSMAFLDMSPKLINDEDWDLGLNHGNFNFIDTMNAISVINNNWMKYAKSFIRSAVPYLSDKDLQPTFEQAATNSPLVMASMWHAMSQADYRPILDKINVEVSIIYGVNSTLYTAETAQYLQDNIRNSKLIPIENATHFLVMEQPKDVSNAIRQME